MCLEDLFGPLTCMYIQNTCFDCFPLYRRGINTVIHLTFSSLILWTLTVKLGSCKKCFLYCLTDPGRVCVCVCVVCVCVFSEHQPVIKFDLVGKFPGWNSAYSLEQTIIRDGFFPPVISTDGYSG